MVPVRWLQWSVVTMCEDYPCCGHTPADPCGTTGASADDYLLAWSRRGAADDDYDPFDDYYR